MRTPENGSSDVAPINSLPPEILFSIFHIILQAQPELLDVTDSPHKVSLLFPKYPDILSHVCSRWRQIAISSRALWTQIDLVLHHPLGPGFLARAKAHIERAGESPLAIYMTDPNVKRIFNPLLHVESHQFTDLDFLGFTQKPINTLSLVSFQGLCNEHYHFIQYCVTRCVPQTLKKLVIRDAYGFDGPYGFIEFARDPCNSRNLQVDLPEQSLENVWSSISVLHLAGLYPHWTSRAYQQLVDLRLGYEVVGSPPISEAQIVAVLKASPGLRVFHLHLNPIDPLPDNASISTIRLDELESLNLSFEQLKPSQILRFITPGQKPMQLSIFGPPTDATEQFLRRSNVTQLRMVGWGTYPPFNALRLCPNLRVFVLDIWDASEENSFQTTREQDDEDVPVAPIRIQALYILYGDGMALSNIQRLVENHSVQELTLWNTHPFVGDGRSSDSRVAFEPEVHSLCPVVHYLETGDKNPMDDWDLF